MLLKKIILVGGGGHCKSCIEVIESENKYLIQGIIDRPEKKGQQVCGYPVIAADNELKNYVSADVSFLITAGQIKDCSLRIKLAGNIAESGGKLAVVISPKAVVSKYSRIYEGVIIMHHVVVNADAHIGTNCIINTSAIIEHDTVIGRNTHISTMACINGNCIIGEECFIGSNAVINQGITITTGTIIGSGTVVNKSIFEPGIYAGNPVIKIS